MTIPLPKWIVALALSLIVAIPLYFIWNHLAPVYFYWLPDVYRHIPFWDVVWLTCLLLLIRMLLIGKSVFNLAFPGFEERLREAVNKAHAEHQAKEELKRSSTDPAIARTL